MTWNQVLHGRSTAAWDFLNPDPSSVDWPTIALVLARLPRFNGHTTQGVYSVAQHLVEGARAILCETGRRDWAGAYLLHDVHEFIIGDDVRPKVEALAQLAGQAAWRDLEYLDKDFREEAARWLRSAFAELKARADAVIYPAAGLAWPLSSECAEIVKQFDNRMLRTEADARTGPRVAPWALCVEDAEPIQGADMSPWPTLLAERLWLEAAKELLPALQSTPSVPVASAGCDCCGPELQAPCGGMTGSEMERADVRDWCDWADGSRPGTCTACGGVFGMLARPSVCKRG